MFKNVPCFEKHIEATRSGYSTCCQLYMCRTCNQFVDESRHRTRPHECYEKFCRTCNDFFPVDHQCYMLPLDPKEVNSKPAKYVFFEFRFKLDDVYHCSKGFEPGDEDDVCTNCSDSRCGSENEIRPNFCVAHKVCSKCLGESVDSESSCPDCGKNERVFYGPDACRLFCRWLFSEENNGVTALCHNFKSFESYPILNYLHDSCTLPKVVTQGSQYMSIKVAACDVRILDSFNFTAMPLGKMPKAFGERQLVEGYFPHLFNRAENQHVVLESLPAAEFYDPLSMKPEARKDFSVWHEQHRNDRFDFREELMRYCRNDVDVLRRCCLKFRSLFMDLTRKDGNDGIDPFADSITIASACMRVYRTNYLEPETIGIIPHHGYNPKAKQSMMASQWLAYVARSEKIAIRHARNGGEKHVGKYAVDGYCESEDVVFEFHGCVWHGCPKCYCRTMKNPYNDKYMTDLYASTKEKQEYIEKRGHRYVSIWECEFKDRLKGDVEFRENVRSLKIAPPLEPGDAFYGGRTEGFKLYAEANDTEKIKYYDVTSLNPYVNKCGKVPLGHPKIITENFDETLDSYEGLISCKILAPRRLYIPVLPSKINGKLVFALCRTCSELKHKGRCDHSPDDRAFVGSWLTEEVKEAVRQGYQILKILGIWHFDRVAQYDPVSKTGGVFTDYINAFLKVKQENSGWPDWCRTEEDRRRYISQYYEHEGILLEYDKIQKNPGLRSLAKLMLNSFWGKFGQRSGKSQTSYIDEPHQFIDLMTSGKQIVKNVRFVNAEAVQVDWSYANDFTEVNSKSNVVIAAYTTGLARLELYKYLRPLGDRVLYCDTDSVVFTAREDQWSPILGDYLGELTDEVPDGDITKFVTGGPKNYAYVVKKRSADSNDDELVTCCKVKGITQNEKNSIEINFNTIRDMVHGAVDSVQVADDRVVRDRSTGTLRPKMQKKTYRLVFDKRVLIPETRVSFPYGYS
jgi:hypothetical protein